MADQSSTGGASSPSKPFSLTIHKKRPRFSAVIAFALTFVFLLLAFSPAITPVKAYSWTEAVEDAATIAGGAVIGAAIGTAVGDGIGAIIGYAVGGLIGALIAFQDLNVQGDPAYLNAKTVFATNLKNQSEDAINWGHTHAANTLQLYDTSTFYFARKAEWAAKALYDYQTANSLAHVYDANWVLSHSEVANGTLAYQWAIQECYNSIFRGLTDISQQFVGDYAGMYWGIGSMQGPVDMSLSSTSNYNPYVLNVLCAVIADGGAGVQNQIFSSNTTNYIITNSASGGDVTLNLTYPDGTLAYAETKHLSATGQGAAEVWSFALEDFGLQSGQYQLTLTGTATMFGNTARPMTNPGAYSPAIITMLKSGETALGYCYQWLDGGFVYAQYFGALSGLGADAGYPKLAFGPDQYVTAYFQDPAFSVSLKVMLDDLLATRTHTSSILTSANNFAQSYYNLLVSHTGGVAPLPDIIFPDPNQMANMTWQQIYAIYIAYLREMQDWFANNTFMDETNVNISVESFDLLCRGSIRNAAGVDIADNSTVWTPYVSIADMTITAGERNTFTQPGFIIIWGNATSLASPVTNQSVKYIPITAGWSVWPVEIYYQGVARTEVTLNVTSLDFIITPDQHDITPPQGATDLAWLLAHWYLIALVLGVVILLGAIVVKNWMLLLVGIAIVLIATAAWYLSDGFALLGDLLGGFNLRAR